MENLTFTLVESDADRAEYLRIRNIDQDHMPLSMEQFVENDRIHPAELDRVRWLVWDSGRCVATAIAVEDRSTDGKHYWVHSAIADLADPRGTELLIAAHRHLTEYVRSKGGTRMEADTRSTRAMELAALEASGYREHQRNPTTSIDPTVFGFAPWRPVLDRLRGEGVEICPLAELIERFPDDWQRRYYDVETETARDVPRPVPFVPTPFEEVQAHLTSKLFRAEGRYFALDGDQWVGLTELSVNRVDPTVAHTGLTGVLRSHRRRGIASALKAVSLEWAKGRGVRRIITDNEENNPMYQLNLQLGYRLDFDWILVSKEL